MYDSPENAVRAAAPGQGLVLVTKADADQSPTLRALRVYVADADAPATLKITPLVKADGVTPAADADAVTLTFPAGVHIHPFGARRVWSTGSTANAVVHGVPVGA
jgi:hypothetical protein